MSITTGYTEKLRFAYRLQQETIRSITCIMEAADGGCRRLEDTGTGLEDLAVQLQDVTNRSRLVIRRTEKRLLQNRGKEPGDEHLLSAARRHSLLQSFSDLHDTASSVAESLCRFAAHLRYLEDLSGISVFTMKHLLLRERVNMAFIHRNNTEAERLSRNCSGKVPAEPWYNGRGQKRYSHLSAFRAAGELHSRYYAAARRFVVNVKNMTPGELAAELAGLERMWEQLTGETGELQRHVVKLMEAAGERRLLNMETKK